MIAYIKFKARQRERGVLDPIDALNNRPFIERAPEIEDQPRVRLNEVSIRSVAKTCRKTEDCAICLDPMYG